MNKIQTPFTPCILAVTPSSLRVREPTCLKGAPIAQYYLNKFVLIMVTSSSVHASHPLNWNNKYIH